MKTKLIPVLALVLVSAFNLQPDTAHAQGTAFTYQGRLNDGANPANGIYDLRFAMYDSLTSGAQQGVLVTNATTSVSNGLFTATLDFGSQFPGASRWLEIAVRTNGAASFFTLSPRQPLTPAPYAITAGSVVSGGLPAGTYGNAVTFSNSADSFSGAFAGNGGGLTNVNVATLGGLTSASFWQLGGNTVSSGQFLGSANNQPVVIQANNLPVMQLAYASNSVSGYSPNVIGGNSINSVGAGVVGGTVGGGGRSGTNAVLSPNRVNADFGTVSGGSSNAVSSSGTYAFIGGGQGNTANQALAAIGGGYQNAANNAYAVIGGGFKNTAGGPETAVGGGAFNAASGSASTVVGGYSNNATGSYTIAGGASSQAGGYGSIALGASIANANYATALGASTASSDFSTAMGYSSASGHYSTALGQSTASTNYATALGDSTADGFASTALGYSTADGFDSTAMGSSSAEGYASFAAGYYADAATDASFVWSDGTSYSSGFVPFTSTAPGQFLIQASGGVGIGLDNPTAALHVASEGNYLTPQAQLTQQNSSDACRLRLNVSPNQAWEMDVTSGSSPNLQFWYVGASGPRLSVDNAGNVTAPGNVTANSFITSSDRNLKENFSAVSPREVLDKVAALPITRWNFKTDAGTAHVGPTAQDFYAAFGTGADDRHIATVDEGGVALAAIQGLNEKLESGKQKVETQVEKLAAENAELKQSVAELKAMLQTLIQNK